MARIRMIGSMKNLNTTDNEKFVSYLSLEASLNNVPEGDFVDVTLWVDGGSPTIKPLSSADSRNGYTSKQLSYVREFTINTGRLYNHNEDDVALMHKLDAIHTFPFHYFSFYTYNENDILECTHKSFLGSDYYTAEAGFVVVTFQAPSIKNNYADKKSEYNPHRIYSWKATEYGIRSVKDCFIRTGGDE